MQAVEKVRYAWIDYAKVFSILLVISFHTPPEMHGFGAEILRLLRMPAFFLIAGYLFDINKFSSFLYFLKHRSRQLLIPYCSFFVIFYALWLLCGKYGNGVDKITPLLQFIKGTPEIVLLPYWFITCLFSMQIIYYILQRIFPAKYLFFVCFALSFSMSFVEVSFYWNIDAAFKYLVFYAFANCFKNYISNLKISNSYKIIFFFTALSFIFVYLNSEFKIFYIQDILNKLSGLFILPLYICFIKVLGDKLGNNKVIELIGKNTIIILALHYYEIIFIKNVCAKYVNSAFLEDNYYLNPLITLFVVLSLYYPIKWINKYIPFIIGRRKIMNE